MQEILCSGTPAAMYRESHHAFYQIRHARQPQRLARRHVVFVGVHFFFICLVGFSLCSSFGFLFLFPSPLGPLLVSSFFCPLSSFWARWMGSMDPTTRLTGSMGIGTWGSKTSSRIHHEAHAGCESIFSQNQMDVAQRPGCGYCIRTCLECLFICLPSATLLFLLMPLPPPKRKKVPQSIQTTGLPPDDTGQRLRGACR